ncbi:MAG: ArsR family transcriptional regulator [Thermoplasmata archaeon]|nr:ArsR family transcriptional regulator [Thermoplasmata archaeon]
MKPPCELIVSKILPSIRAAIVKQLIEDHNMKQTQISTILGISQSAVSQYYTSARAADESALALFPEIVKYAKDVAGKIANGKISKDQILLCEPCQRIREDDKFCDFHKEFDQFMKCKICQESSD